MKTLLSILFLVSCLYYPVNAEQSASDGSVSVDQASIQYTISLLDEFQTVSENLNVQQRCCKVCSKGKACGNSCISRSKTCHQPPGCACDG